MFVATAFQVTWTDKEIDALVQYDLALPGDKSRSYNRQELDALRVRIFGALKSNGIYEFSLPPVKYATICQQDLIRIALGIEDVLEIRRPMKRGADRSYLRH